VKYQIKILSDESSPDNNECLLVCKSTKNLNFFNSNSNPNECVQIQHKQLPSYHVLIFFTHTVFPQLELTFILQKTNRIYFSSKSRGICPKQYYFTQPNASQTIGLWYFFDKNHALCTIPV
jgi:hypothetical protein